MVFSERLNALMAERGLNNSQMARGIGFSDRLISGWRREECGVSLKNAVTLAEYFGVSIDYLAGRTDVREMAKPPEPEPEPVPDPDPEEALEPPERLKWSRIRANAYDGQPELKKFALRLSRLINSRRLPMYKIGNEIGVSGGILSAMCAGKRGPNRIEDVVAIADYFHVSVDYVLCRSDVPAVAVPQEPAKPDREEGIKKEPALGGISENGKEMLALYETLPVREQLLLLGRLQEMCAPLVTRRAEPPASASSAAAAKAG